MHTSPQQPGEPFAAAIARRMLSQGQSTAPQQDVEAAWERARELASGFSVTREAVAQQLQRQHVLAGAAISEVWPQDARMEAVSQMTVDKATHTAGDDLAEESEGDVRPRG